MLVLVPEVLAGAGKGLAHVQYVTGLNDLYL